MPLSNVGGATRTVLSRGQLKTAVSRLKMTKKPTYHGTREYLEIISRETRTIPLLYRKGAELPLSSRTTLLLICHNVQSTFYLLVYSYFEVSESW
jgi:hypothetical protein